MAELLLFAEDDALEKFVGRLQRFPVIVNHLLRRLGPGSAAASLVGACP
jgi:hypothetical protein